MAHAPTPSSEPRRPFRRVMRTFLIEMSIYGVLLIAYFFLVLKFLAIPLGNLFHSNLIIYAIASLGLIVLQGVALDTIVYFIIDLFKLNR
jgi:hypothetical protein